MDFAPAPARGEGGRRADRSGGGWGADGAPLTVRIRVPGRFENQPTGIVGTEKGAFTEVAARKDGARVTAGLIVPFGLMQHSQTKPGRRGCTKSSTMASASLRARTARR